MHPVFHTFLVLLFGVLVLMAGAYILWLYLHLTLCRKLDPILFREPYFRSSELINYRYWPLNALRSLNYIYLLALPAMAKKKRFNGFNLELPVGLWLKALAKVQLLLLISMVLWGVGFLVFMSWALYGHDV